MLSAMVENHELISSLINYLPAWYVVLIVFVLGAVIGSFLNVVIYRLNTNRSLNGRSHCMSCGKSLHWYELIPLVSYLALRGRCSGCGSYITPRYFSVELATGLMFVSSLLASDTWVELSLLLVVMSVLVVIVVYDYNHLIIPDRLVISLIVLATINLSYRFWQGDSLDALSVNIISALGGSLFFYGLWYLSKGKWLGLGDAKLAFPLGLLAGGATEVFSMTVLSFWIGATVSLFILATLWLLKRGQMGLHFTSLPLTMKSEVPFAPFLVAGFLVAYLFDVDVIALLTYVP